MFDTNYNIALKQLRSAEIADFISGLNALQFTGLANAYSNYSQFAHITGNEIITGSKVFNINPTVLYTGSTGQVVSKLYVDNQDIVLQNNINVNTTGLQNVAHLTGRGETFIDEKRFEKIIFNSGRATGLIEVPYPSGPSGAINLEYLANYVANINSYILYSSGDQNISGNKAFFGATVFLPTATDPSGGIPLQQLSNTGNNLISRLTTTGVILQNQIDNLTDLAMLTGVSGFGGVLSFNTQSGNIFSQGRGSVTTTQVGNIFNVSGHTLQAYTGAFLGFTNLLSGVDRQFINYGKIYENIPYVFAQLESPSGNLSVNYYVSGRTNNGFNLIFSNTLTTSGYGLSYFGWTGSGAVVNTVQGPQGLQGRNGYNMATGDNVNINFYFDYIYTGLNLVENFICKDFTITGYAIGAVNSGRGPGHLNSGASGLQYFRPLTGEIYQRDTLNNKSTLFGFSFNSGQIYSGSGFDSSSYLSFVGSNRLGVDIFSGLSGISNVTIGVFGFGA